MIKIVPNMRQNVSERYFVFFQLKMKQNRERSKTKTKNVHLNILSGREYN